jgi:hypothetical protein
MARHDVDKASEIESHHSAGTTFYDLGFAAQTIV